MINETAFIHDTAEIGDDVKVGAGSKIWAQAQLGNGASLGEKCIVGKGAYIDRGVQIGNNAMIHNYVLLYRPLTVEDDVFIGPQVANANDPDPVSNEIRDIDKDSGTVFKKGCRIGMSATIAPNLTIGAYAFVEMRALVTKSVPDHGIVRGMPGRLVGFACFCGTKLGPPRPIVSGAGDVELACEKDGCGKVVKIPVDIYHKVK